jgi:hypothetical protein
MKRITSSLLALLLALSMLIGMVPAAYAAPADTIESIDPTETVDSSETEDVSDESKEVAVHAAGETAETEYAAFSGSTYWTTLQEAINEGPYNIYLAKDVTETVTIPAGKTVNVSLYGHQLHGSITNNGNLTIDTYKQYHSHPDIGGGDATITNEGTLKLACDGATGFVVNNSGALNITGGATYKVSNITNTSSGVIEITSGTFDAAPDSSWLRAGYKATLKSGTYSVSAMTNTEAAGAGFVAYGGTAPAHYYTTLQDAITDNSSTVNVIADVEEDCVKTNGDIILFFVSPSKFTGSLKASGDIKITNGPAVLNNVECNSFTAKKGSWKNTTDITIKDGKVNNITVEESSTNYGVTVAITGGTYTGTVSETTEDTLTISGGKFTADVTNYLAKGATYDVATGVVTPGTTDVAKVGETPYATLGAAFNALSSTDYTLTLLDESAWDTATPVYWEAGTQSGYVAKLTDALTAAYKANAAKIKIVCRPGADVGTMTHGHVADDITIYGNNAYISGGECELEVDTYKFSRETGAQDTTNGVYLDKDIVINAYELDNLGVWGERHTAHTVNVNLTDCDGKAIEGKENVQRVYISGTSGVNNITLTGCDFMTNNTSVYSNADGAISIKGCSFTGSTIPVNFNHKAGGSQTLNVEGCSFTSCGDNGDWKQFAAPVRFVNSGSGTQSATVDTCTFAGTVGSNGDILIGDGRTGQESNDVTLTVTNTTATVQAQKPGYYDGTATDETKGAKQPVTSGETLNTSVEKMLPTALTAYVTVNGGTEQYATLDEAIAAAEPENGVITYTVTGKVNANGESWIQVAKAGLTGLTEVKFVGADANAEICITNSTAVLADQSYDIDVSFKDLTLSHPNGAWVSDLGHATNYFTTVLRNTDAANNTVSYTNCTFPNGACNNQYGKTVYANCKFTNATSGKYNLWNYGGNTEIKNSTFTGTRGIKAYSEGTDGGDISISGTTFDDLNEKAAIVASKPVGIVLDNVAVTGDSSKGLFTRDISGNDELTISATGTGISGTFDITSDATGANAKDELNISAGTFNSEVSSDYCADGFEVKANENGTYGVVQSTQTTKGTRENPYTLDDLSTMTRADYIAAQERLGGTMYVTVGDYSYETNGTLGNGTADNSDRDSTKMNYYGAPGAKEGQYSDAAVGKNIVFVGSSITSNVTGYKDIDNIGTSLLLAVPAYTNVTFKGITFNNVMSFNYQLYTSPWSQLGELKFDQCTFNGIIVGAIAAQTLTFDQCVFTDYTNTVSANSSNPTWIRPAYGNWTKGDNEGQGNNFKSLTAINFTGNTVVSTRPVKFERIAQWEMPTTVTVTGNSFDIRDTGEKKNVGLYFGANAKFNLIAQDNTKSDNTAALYTAAYKAPNEKDYVGLPAGSTVKDSTGKDVELEALEWKSDNKLTLKTTEEVASVTNAKGTVVNFASLSDAIAAANDGDTVTLLKSCNGNGIKIETKNFATKGLTVDFGGNTYSVGGVLVGSTGTGTNAFQLLQGGKVTFQNGTIAGVTKGTKPAEGTTNWHGAPAMVIQNYCDLTLKSMTITGGDETVYTMSNNHGDIVIEDTTITAGGAKGYGYGPFAFDVCGYSSYTGVSVTVRGNSIINGDIEVSRSNANDVKLTLESGKINGKLKIDESIKPGDATTITKSDVVTLDAPSGYKWDNGTLTKITYVAEVNGKQYDSLQAAITEAADNDTVTLLADTTEDVVINKDITLDLGGKTLTNTNAGKATISVTGGTVTVKNGNVIGGTDYYNIEVTKDSNANLTLEGVTATAGNTGSSMIDNWGTMTITSGEYSGGLNTVKSEEGSTLNISGGKFISNYAPKYGVTGTILVYGTTTISGGEFIQNSTSTNARVVVTGLVEGYPSKTYVTGGTFTTKPSGAIFHGLGKATSDNFEVSGGTFNKSIPAGYCADGYIPTKNADGTYGVKEGSYVAKIGSTYYESLADAVAKANKNSKAVTLVANVTGSIEIVSTKTCTIDLNGFTLTNTEGKHTIVNNGTLTIKDSSTAQTGTVDNVTHGCGALVNNGTVILSGGTFERSAEKGTLEPYGNGGNSWYTIANYGTMTINNGTTVKNAGGYSSNIRNGGQDSTAKLTINGGTFDGGVNTVKNDANGVLEIKGGELKNTAQYVIMNWNQATISGGTFETAETAGAVLFSSAYGTDGTACGELTITGGTFTAAGSKLIDDAYDANNHGTVKISGGSFNRAVDPKHCDTGFIPTQNEDGTYGVKEGTYVAETGGVYYESLQAAIDAAPRKGTVKLLADTRENVTINTPYLTLDLNGHTLNGGTEKGKPALTVTARVTVKDGSEAQTGTIMREDTAENSGVSSHYVIDIQGSGWLTFESGNVKNGSGVVGVKGASLVRVGDDSVAKYPGLNIKGGTFTQDNFIVIKVDRGDLFLNGGTLNSANSYAIEDWHRATIKGGTVNGAVAAWTYSGGLNSDLTISGGTINGDVTSVNYGNAEGRTAKVSITGGRVTGKLDTRSYDPATNELTSIDDAAKATIEVTGGTFNNDPTKYVVENSKVTNNADGTFGVEKAYLAKIGDKSYYTMDEAFHAVTEGQTIVLLRDYTTASSQNSGSKSFTFDLNGHTWTYTSTDVNYAAFEINYPDVTLTVKNGKVVSNSMLGLIPSAMGGTITYDNAGLVFEGIDATANGHSGIETNGNNTNDSVTLKNSTLNVPNGFGIYFPSSGTLTIENSKINAKTMGVQVCAGSLKISGADTAITVTGDAVPKTENDGAIQDGAAISIVNRTGYKGLGTITVTGGTFTAKTGNAAIKAYNYADKTESSFNESDKVEVSGGTFSAEVPADLCAVGYEPTKMDTGMYTVQKVSGNAYYVDDSGKPVYGDFAALVASTNAATKGKTITLLKNVKIEDNLVLFGNRTVDLNGNVLEITEIFIGLYGKVIDSSDGNGLLKIAADNVTLQSDNGLLPIYDSAKGGYRLFSFTMKQQVTKPSDTTVKFKFGPIFENKEAYKLLLTGNNHNIKVTVTLKWISGDGRTGEQTFTFPQNLINGIGAAEGGSGFVINLTGFDSDITGSVSNVTAQWAISSGTGASVSGTPSVIYE